MGTVAIMTLPNHVSMPGSSVTAFDAILRMLKSIPEVNHMFQNKLFRKGCQSKMPICEEIGLLFETKNVDLSSSAYLRFLITGDNSEKIPRLGENQDFAEIFRIIYERVKKELSFSNLKSMNVWKKFRRSYSKNCGNCELLGVADSPTILEVTPLECSRTTVTRLINSSKLDPEDNQDNECLLCHAVKEDEYVHLPSFLLVQVVPRPSSRSGVFPENKMTLVNGDTYQLKCIVDHDDVTAVVDENTWVRCDGAKHTPASKDDVKNTNNKFFLYVKMETPCTMYKCKVVGCPFDRDLGSSKDLSRHARREHPRCRHCKKIFLLSCLYREHLIGSNTCQFNLARKEAFKVPSKKEDTEVLVDSGLESMSDSAGEEPVTLTMKRNDSGKYEVKSLKRKSEVKDQSCKRLKRKNLLTVSEKETVENSNTYKVPDCTSCRCVTNGHHWCQYPPIEREGHLLKTRGTLLRDKSFVNGVQTFVPFNNSFLEVLGCQFYFKNKEGVIEITSYSQEGQEYEYQLTLSSKNSNKTSPVKARIGERRRVAAFELDNSSVQYDLVV